MRTLASRHVGRLLSAALAAMVVGAGGGAAEARRQEPTVPDLGSMSLEELMRVEIQPVIGASRRLQPTTEAPASVTIVTAEDIARHGYRTLADVLRSVRGFYVTYDRNYSYVGVRGFSLPGDYNSRILLLVNGHRLNDNIFDQAQVGPELGLDPAWFERVEIIRGPASSLYGTNAFFAVINIITKTGASVHGGSVAVDTGSYGTWATRMAVGRRLDNGMDVALFGTVERSDGPARLYFPEFDTPETHGGIAEHLDDEDIVQAFGRVAAGHFTLSGAFGHRGKRVPTAAFETVFGDPRLRTNDDHGFVDGQYEHAIGRTQVNVHAYLDRYWYDGTYPIAGWDDTPPVVLSTDYGHGVWLGVEGRVTRPLGTVHTLTIGAEARRSLRQNQGWAYEGYAEDGHVEGASRVMAGYVQDEIRVTRRLMVNAGARFDHYSASSSNTPEGSCRSNLAPRIGVIFNSSRNQALKYLYGRAFRAPNAYELDYWDESGSLKLDPEQIRTHEIVWEQYAGRWLRLSAAGFWSHAQSLIAFRAVGDGNYTFVNDGSMKTKGFEFEGEVHLASGLRTSVSYVAQRSEDADGAWLSNSPRHVLIGLMTVPGPAGIVAALDVQHMSERLTVAGDVVSPATIANLTVRAPLARGFGVSATVRNLFNRAYSDPASEEHREDTIPQDARTFRVGLQWTFGTK